MHATADTSNNPDMVCARDVNTTVSLQLLRAVRRIETERSEVATTMATGVITTVKQQNTTLPARWLRYTCLTPTGSTVQRRYSGDPGGNSGCAIAVSLSTRSTSLGNGNESMLLHQTIRVVYMMHIPVLMVCSLDRST